MFFKKRFELRFEIVGSEAESTSPELPISPDKRAPDDESTTSGSNPYQKDTSHFHSNYIVITKKENSEDVQADSYYADSSRSNANKSYAQSISTRILHGIENMWPDAKMDYLNVRKNPIRVQFPEDQQDLTCWAYALASISCLNALPAGFTKTDAEAKLQVLTQDVMSVIHERLIHQFDDLLRSYKLNKSAAPTSNDDTISDMASQTSSQLSATRSITAKAPPSISRPKVAATEHDDASDLVETDIYKAAAAQFRRNQDESSLRDGATGTSSVTRGYYTVKITADPGLDGKDRAREGMRQLIEVINDQMSNVTVHPASPSLKITSTLPPITADNSDNQHDLLSYIHIKDGRSLYSQQEVNDRDPMGEAKDIYGTVIIEHPTVSPANLPKQCTSRLASFDIVLWTKVVQCLDTVKSRALVGVYTGREISNETILATLRTQVDHTRRELFPKLNPFS